MTSGRPGTLRALTDFYQWNARCQTGKEVRRCDA